MMKILIAGNMGYIGPNVTKHLRTVFPNAELIGFDIGYFSHCLTNPSMLPEVLLDQQIFGDIRKFPETILSGVDAVVDLAAISNDPMGKEFEEITYDVNFKAAVELAKKAKAAGVKNFVYASSCSVYGFASDYPKTEKDSINPLTAYASSKDFCGRET
jgi:nucleoside-diphosphate-sugar epimerase